MTREEAIERLKNYTQYRCGGVDLVALNMAIQALESQPRFLVHSDGEIEQIIEPCGDAISRQVVKEQMLKYGFHAPDMTVTEFVEDLPPVLPKRERSDKE